MAKYRLTSTCFVGPPGYGVHYLVEPGTPEEKQPIYEQEDNLPALRGWVPLDEPAERQVAAWKAMDAKKQADAAKMMAKRNAAFNAAY